MAKTATLTTITAGYGSYSQLNTNFTNINTALSNTLSLDGSTPNSMLADFDLNSNDLLNGGTLYADDIVIDGTSLIAQVQAAAASATAAAASATAAAASATSAAASYDSFDDRYLGAKSSDPSVDNDGNALVTGALYFNTTSNTMKVYNGVAWGDLTIPTTLLSLTDFPSSYSGQGGLFLRVNVGETAVEFTASASSVGDADYGDITVSSSGSVWTIDDNAVTLAKLSDGTQGGIIYYGASGAPTELAAGTVNKMLMSNGAGANPSWEYVDGTSIRMGSDAQGDVLYFNGTDYVRLGAGTSGQFLKTNGAGANPAWADVSLTASGSPVQTAIGTSTTGTNVTASTPVDNTIPQITEGTEIVTVAITPTNAGSTIIVEGVLQYTSSTNGQNCVLHVHVDSDADAIFATLHEADSGDLIKNVPFMFSHAPGDTSAHTYRLRVGVSTGTAYVNQRIGGTAAFSTAGPVTAIKVTEILP